MDLILQERPTFGVDVQHAISGLEDIWDNSALGIDGRFSCVIVDLDAEYQNVMRNGPNAETMADGGWVSSLTNGWDWHLA